MRNSNSSWFLESLEFCDLVQVEQKGLKLNGETHGNTRHGHIYYIRAFRAETLTAGNPKYFAHFQVLRLTGGQGDSIKDYDGLIWF